MAEQEGRSWGNRVRDWVRVAPSHTELEILPPKLDPRVDAEMAAVAAVVAENLALDFSSASIAQVEAALSAPDCDGCSVYQLGAYVGEILRRSAPNARWGYQGARETPRNPGVVVGQWVTQPFELVERYTAGAKRDPEDTLVRAFGELLTWATSPTDEAAAALGWTDAMLYASSWDALRAEACRWRRRWRRRRVLRMMRRR